MAIPIEVRRIAVASVAAAATALLVWFGTGLFPWWPLLWVAPLPVLLLAARASGRATGLAAIAAWAVGSLNMSHYYSAALHVPFVGRFEIVVAPALVFALAVLLYRVLLRRGLYWSALAGFPAVWVCFEYLFSLASPHGTAISVAYTQLNFLPILQLASITGPWGISFLALAFPAALAIGIHLRVSARRQALRIAGAALAVVALVLAWGVARLAVPPPPGPLVRVGLLASDQLGYLGVAAPGAETDIRLRNYAAQAEALAAQGPQVLVLPEHLGVVADPHTANTDAIFQWLAQKTRTTIVAGVAHAAPSGNANQARIYAPGAAVLSYDKQHLLPPFESMFVPGKSLTMLNEPRGKWGVAICKDMDFTNPSRQYGKNGVGLMLVPAWDFVLDRASHGHIAIMRGVEDGFSIARAARGGYLTVSDNRGRILAETESNAAPFATLVADVPAIHDSTLYLLLGDWFAWLMLVLLPLTLLQLARPRVHPRAGSSHLPAQRWNQLT